MKKARIAELKNNLSRCLEHVRAGGSVLVLDRDRPVARLVPVKTTDRVGGGDSASLARLDRKGLVRLGVGGLPAWLDRPRPRLKGGLLKDLLAERRSGW
jgi:prevent-host-death family protein